jgi:actin-related protein
MNPAKNRETLVEKIFEKYQFGAANVSIQAMLTLYAQVVCDIFSLNVYCVLKRLALFVANTFSII